MGFEWRPSVFNVHVIFSYLFDLRELKLKWESTREREAHRDEHMALKQREAMPSLFSIFIFICVWFMGVSSADHRDSFWKRDADGKCVSSAFPFNTFVVASQLKCIWSCDAECGRIVRWFLSSVRVISLPLSTICWVVNRGDRREGTQL